MTSSTWKVIVAGEPLSRQIRQKFFDLYQKNIIDNYGTSETWGTIAIQDSNTDDWYDNVGTVLSDIEYKIVEGELFVKLLYFAINSEDAFFNGLVPSALLC